MPSAHSIQLPPYRLLGQVDLPCSKSVSNRLLVMEALAGRILHKGELSVARDTQVLQRALALRDTTIDAADAGTALRFLTAYFSTRAGKVLLTGTERMQHRPIGPLVDALRSLGAKIEYVGETGFPPLRIDGQALCGGAVEVEVSVSSQFVSALLLVAPYWKQGLTLFLRDVITSKPYIDLTLSLMTQCGVEAKWLDERTLRVEPGEYQSDNPIVVEPSWTAASYWYEALVAGTFGRACLCLPGLQARSVQGDAVVQSIFSDFGIRTTFADDGATLWSGETTQEVFQYDFRNCPDLVPTLVATCLACKKPFRMSGLHNLRFKESDRVGALQHIATLFGARLEAPEEGVLTFDGVRALQPEGTRVQPLLIPVYDDHRLALAFAPFLLGGWKIKFDNPSVVRKSYPHFWDQLLPLCP
ncbi:MAG: 3-phosphoshikimate 1-carboxyvinyltransferase [Alloprevotella sp.]|nr:3-phosphoshikimate 1-carboxyvinyltransferase [Alloprevotella sp.]